MGLFVFCPYSFIDSFLSFSSHSFQCLLTPRCSCGGCGGWDGCASWGSCGGGSGSSSGRCSTRRVGYHCWVTEAFSTCQTKCRLINIHTAKEACRSAGLKKKKKKKKKEQET